MCQSVTLNFVPRNYHARGKIHFEFPANFLRICICIEFKLIHQKHFSRICIRIYYKINSSEEREVCASDSKPVVLRIVYVCACHNIKCMGIEFVIQVLKQKHAHVSFPVGMVSKIANTQFAIWPAPHKGLPSSSAPERLPGLRPPDPQSPERVCTGVSKESEKSPKT